MINYLRKILFICFQLQIIFYFHRLLFEKLKKLQLELMFKFGSLSLFSNTLGHDNSEKRELALMSRMSAVDSDGNKTRVDPDKGKPGSGFIKPKLGSFLGEDRDE